MCIELQPPHAVQSTPLDHPGVCLQMKQYEMMTIDAGMEPPDPQDAEYSWDTEEIRDFHRAMEVRGGLM